MKARNVVFAAILVAAVAAAFYMGRRTASRPAPVEAHEADSGKGKLVLTPEVQRRFGVQTAAAEMRAIGRVIQATGSVQANDTRLARVRAIARGRIDEVYVRLGDRVKARQRLLTYDNVELGEAIGEYLAALAELRKATAEAEVSRRALERAGNLVELGAVAKAEFQRREAESKYALAAVESRKAGAAKIEEKLHRFGMSDAEIEKLDPRKDLEYHRQQSHSTVRAPFEGVVTQFDAAPGETVGIEDQLMTVADLSTVWVQADIYEKDIHSVREGLEAEVAVASYPGRTFTGRITYISDVLDPNTRTAKVRVEVPNPENRLKLQMFATVRIPAPATRPALVIPAAAVQNDGGRAVTFVKSADGGFAERVLELGARSGEWVEVVAGLTAGETVVTEGSFLLKSEARKSELGHHEE
ncbi:MAG TPA: efflux RND transporter periplasmic adaptor subunit [Bryobacteraceae bacterium]|nr:efflux RND transporter periplasmic adaptor subunit [Bryobacteraceae bacterium]